MISEVLLARGVLWVTLQGWVLFGPWGYLLRPFMPSALTPSLHVKRGFLSLNHLGKAARRTPGPLLSRNHVGSRESLRDMVAWPQVPTIHSQFPHFSFHTIWHSFWAWKSFPTLLCFYVNVLPVQTLSHLWNYYWPPHPRPPTVGL